MLDWRQLKKRPDIIGRIDWDMTPAQAFESYQIKSSGAWAKGSLPDVFYFYVSTWRGRPKLLLVRRTYVDSEDVAQAPAPDELLLACAQNGAGQDYPRGQLPLDPPLRQWLMAELGLEPAQPPGQ